MRITRHGTIKKVFLAILFILKKKGKRSMSKAHPQQDKLL